MVYNVASLYAYSDFWEAWYVISSVGYVIKLNKCVG